MLLHPNPFTGGNNEIPKSFPDSGRRRNSGNDCISLTFEVCCTSKLNSLGPVRLDVDHRRIDHCLVGYSDNSALLMSAAKVLAFE